MQRVYSSTSFHETDVGARTWQQLATPLSATTSTLFYFSADNVRSAETREKKEEEEIASEITRGGGGHQLAE